MLQNYKLLTLSLLSVILTLSWARPGIGQTAPTVSAKSGAEPKLEIEGSFGALYSNNVFGTQFDPASDWFLPPDLKVALTGKVPGVLDYSIYARSFFERYFDETLGDNSAALVGATVATAVGPARTGLVYENRRIFTGIYDSRDYIANDISWFVSRKLEDQGAGVTSTPRLSIGYRFSDTVDVQRAVLDLVIPFEIRLGGPNSRWALINQNRLRFLWFTDGTNEGRRDVIPSTSLGLQYSFSDNVRLTLGASYEVRRSSRADDYKLLQVGPVLDFNF